jgi:hypothetical protein
VHFNRSEHLLDVALQSSLHYLHVGQRFEKVQPVSERVYVVKHYVDVFIKGCYDVLKYTGIAAVGHLAAA